MRFSLILLIYGLLLAGCKSTQVISDLSSHRPGKLDSISTHFEDYFIPDTVEVAVFEVAEDTLLIAGVGDIMMGTNFPDAGYLPPDDGEWLFDDVKGILTNTDLTFGNLEGVLLDSGGTQKHCSNPDVCYLFRTPVHYVSYLVEAGFDVMSLANNHAGDFGEEGRSSTIKTLEAAGIFQAGQLRQPYVIFEKNQITYGFAAFSPNTGTLSINDIPGAVKIINHLDSLSDVVIVSFHGGAEGSKFQHVTRETETFYGENRGNVYEFSHRLIDAGADIIFGHGPHVSRAIEVYKDRFIAYSLGNFCTYARFNLRGENGVAPLVLVKTDPQGRFYSGRIIPIKQEGEGGPIIDTGQEAIKVIRNLTQTDFPELNINIDDDGIITYISEVDQDKKSFTKVAD